MAVSGDTVVVGAPEEDSSATGVNGDQSNNSASDSGAAYVFVRSGTTWSQQAYLKASNTEPYDDFGYSVAVSGDTVVVGASREDSNATGVNGDQANNDLVYAGAAYVFLDTPALTDLGGGLAGVAGIPLLEATGTLEANSPITLTVTGAAPSARAILFVSLANTATPFRGGTLSTTPIESSLVIFTNDLGEWTLPVQSWVEGVPPGTEIFFQLAVQDPAAVERVSISNLLVGTQP